MESDPGQLTDEDFKRGGDWLAEREQALSSKLRTARDMYSGMQHQRLIKGLTAFEEENPAVDVDLWILSAGYGLIPADQEVAPYECTFQGRRKADLNAWAEMLKVPQDFRQKVAQTYDLILILLGDDYLAACQLNHDVALGGPAILFCGNGALKTLPPIDGLSPVPVSNPEAGRFACALIGLKGELAARLLALLSKQGWSLPNNPVVLLDQLESVAPVPKKPKKAVAKKSTEVTKAKRPAARVNPAVDHVIQIPKSWQDKPHRNKLRYFIPEWDDLVDPDYDFATDTHSGGTGDWSNQVYAHQMYREPNYDGLLISKVVAEKSKKKKERINELGVHRFLRVPRDFPIMGDCGAFGYIKEDVPPYTTDEILDYYTRLDFDLGVSVDHLIVTATMAQMRQRYDLTIQNAEDFLKEHRKRGLSWTPIGAVQGWDPKSYAEAARQYVAMGYDYIALGGLVRSSTEEILRVLNEVTKVVPSHVSMHLFGVARLNAVSEFVKLGVNSIDSASYLRQAWMRTKQSYVLPNGESYAALRIPEAGKSFRAKHMREHPDLSDARITELERNALTTVRAYAAKKGGLEDALDALMEFDRFVTSDREDLAPHYRRTLEDRPWEQCGCEICRRDGVEVMIFRGNNRNRRRGFHNTYAFFRLMQNALNGGSDYLPKGVRDQVDMFTAAEVAC